MEPILITLSLSVLFLGWKFRCIPIDLVILVAGIAPILLSIDLLSYISLLHMTLAILWSGFTRFSYGYIFHHVPNQRWIDAHQRYHEEIIRRKIGCKCYYYLDHTIEGVLFTVGIWIDYFLFGPTFAVILFFERFYGQALRMYVRYLDMPADEAQFLRNAEAYYFKHLFEADTCYGFSAPLWDTLNKSNSFTAHLLFDFIPFVSFHYATYFDEFNVREELQKWSQANISLISTPQQTTCTPVS